MEINNFNLIEKQLSFSDKDQFYFIQIIQRKKDGCITSSGNNGYRLIRSFYVYSIEQLELHKNKIIELCNNNNARAYINVNIRNAKQILLYMIQESAKLISENNSYQGYRLWDHCCGKTRDKSCDVLWVIDLDSKDRNYIDLITSIICKCKSKYANPIVYSVPTLHGEHLISHGFDLNEFKLLIKGNNLKDVDVQKDNPTLLYCNLNE